MHSGGWLLTHPGLRPWGAASSDMNPRTQDTWSCGLDKDSTLRLPEALLALYFLMSFFFNDFYRALLEGESNPEILILTERLENLPQGKYTKS